LIAFFTFALFALLKQHLQLDQKVEQKIKALPKLAKKLFQS
jgi:hypothetical protein